MTRPAVHPLLVAAHEGIHPHAEAWNPKRHSLTQWELPHLGGPQPIVPGPAQVEIVFWCAEIAASRLAAAARKPLLELLTTVRAPAFSTSPESERTQVIAALRALERARALPISDDTDPELRLAGLAAVAARRLVSRAYRNAHRTALQAVMTTTRILVRASEPRAMSPEAFVDALDERLMRAEWAAFADRTQTARRLHGDAGARLDSLLYRAGDDKGDGVVWVARLKSTTGPAIGTLVRQRGFQFAEGTPNEALAIVPDAYLEAAADAVLSGQRA